MNLIVHLGSHLHIFVFDIVCQYWAISNIIYVTLILYILPEPWIAFSSHCPVLEDILLQFILSNQFAFLGFHLPLPLKMIFLLFIRQQLNNFYCSYQRISNQFLLVMSFLSSTEGDMIFCSTYPMDWIFVLPALQIKCLYFSCQRIFSVFVIVILLFSSTESMTFCTIQHRD